MRGDFRPLPNKNVQMLDHLFPLLFPKDSESLKIFDIRLWEVEAKRPLNGTSKVNRQTDRQTDTRTHRRAFRLIESIGPEGRCFEKDDNKEDNKVDHDKDGYRKDKQNLKLNNFKDFCYYLQKSSG